MKEPVVPPASQQPGGKYDTMYAYRYYKTHYWDGVSFMDDRLVRTPFFDNKLDKYFKETVSPVPDSIIREVDWMLLYSRTAKEMYRYLMVHFVQKYINPEYMGQDAVFLHIFEKFINTGEADFFTEKYRKIINDRAYSLMANQIGQSAANLDMVDSSGKPVPLLGIEAKFILVCFWDPTCSHCKEEVPELDSIYEAKWKNEGVKIYGVMVDGGQDNWRKFIRDHNLKDWINVYQPKDKADADEAANRPGYKQLYDVYQTPTLFLLDKNKRIIAKKLNYQQFDHIIDLKLKKEK
jgi:thiol-disulfide isomerase/thioredoxin